MRTAMAMLVGLGVIVLGSCLEASDDRVDSEQSRTEAAERYLKAVPAKGLMADMAEEMAKKLPPSEGAAWQANLLKNLDMLTLENEIKRAMVKHFTVAEIDALADFYGSREGQSIMKKFGVYMAEIQPALQREIQAAAFGRALPLEPSGPRPLPTKDQDSIQGEWKFVHMEENGSVDPADKYSSFSLIFAKDTVSIVRDGKIVSEGTYTIDDSVNPKHINMKHGNEDMPGIYKFEGKRLVICSPARAGRQQRPKEFKTEKYSNTVLDKLERINKP